MILGSKFRLFPKDKNAFMIIRVWCTDGGSVSRIKDLYSAPELALKGWLYWRWLMFCIYPQIPKVTWYLRTTILSSTWSLYSWNTRFLTVFLNRMLFNLYILAAHEICGSRSHVNKNYTPFRYINWISQYVLELQRTMPPPFQSSSRTVTCG